MEIWGFKVQFRLCPSPQFIQTSALYENLICTAAISSWSWTYNPLCFPNTDGHFEIFPGRTIICTALYPSDSQGKPRLLTTTFSLLSGSLHNTGEATRETGNNRSVRNDALVERSVRRSRVAGRRVHTGLAEIGTTREEEREAKWGKLKSLPLNALSNHQFLMQQNHQSILCCRSEGSHKTASSLLLFHRSPLLSFTCLHLNALWRWWSIYYIAF